MVKPKANQSKAYRAAFHTQGMRAKTIHNEASKLMKDPDITARITELITPAIEKVQMTREAWFLEMEKIARADVRKLFDRFGNPIQINQLTENEAAIIEGFEVAEHFRNVKKANGRTDVVPTGCTKKYKFTSRVKALLALGRAMGWYAETKAGGSEMTLEQLVLGSMKGG